MDPDKAFISGVADLVRNEDGEVVATKTFDAEHITFRIDTIELNTEYTLIAKMTYDRDTNEIEEETNPEEEDMAGINFVITGKVNIFANRNSVKEIIEARGGKVTGSVTSKTNFLINNDVLSNSSKNKKAKELLFLTLIV